MKKSHSNLELSILLIVLLWLILLVDVMLPVDLRQFGIRPRQIDSLGGILFAPFLHADLSHLIANSGALFVLMLVSLSYNRRMTFQALAIIIVAGGLLVWIFGTPRSVHIGASGVVFGLIGFLLFTGFFRREWSALLVSIIVFLLYGGALLSLFVHVPGISWSSHFFGFLAGVLAAWLNRSGR